jgi:outer membrane protein assembly factor BamE (lipoprotein component of BamABCDE complex)
MRNAPRPRNPWAEAPTPERMDLMPRHAFRPRRPALLLAAAAALALAPACARTPNVQGYVVDEELLAGVQPGVDNKQSVQRALGRPTMMSQWDDSRWYYVSRQTGQRAFLRPIPTAQSILIVNFDEAGTVVSVERRGLEKVADITPERDRTPTLGRETGILEDLFGNIGQVGTGVPAGGPPQ